jgi:hypothetical protein
MEKKLRNCVQIVCLLALLLPFCVLNGCGSSGDSGVSYIQDNGGSSVDAKGAVEGTIIEGDSQTALGGVTVAVGSLGTTTDGNGFYRIEGVPAGTQMITATKQGLDPEQATVTISAGQVSTMDIPMYNVQTGWLKANTAYKWQVEAVDTTGTTTAGPVWSFTTGASMTPDPESAPPAKALISSETAWKVARAHLDESGMKDTTLADVKMLNDKAGSTALAFVFSLNPAGYIVVPCRAVDTLPPVLAYSFTSNFSWDESQDNVLLAMLRRDITLRSAAFKRGIGVRGDKTFSHNRALWQAYANGGPKVKGTGAKAVGPLFTFDTWSQGVPYRNLCPWDYDYDEKIWKKCPVGCTATAMAQVLNYYKTVTSLTFTSVDSYTTRTNKIWVDALPASFSGLDYNNGDPDNSAKAKLSFACGVLVLMNYQYSGSGAPLTRASSALNEKCGFTGTQYESFTQTTFSSANIAASIERNAPCILHIKSTEKGGAHAIVCDGYNADTSKFHLNFGWGSSSDGWYTLPDGMPASYDVVVCDVNNIGTSTRAPEVLPIVPQNPDPSEGATSVDTDTSLDWSQTANNGHYNLYVWEATETKPSTPTEELSISSY